MRLTILFVIFLTAPGAQASKTPGEQRLKDIQGNSCKVVDERTSKILVPLRKVLDKDHAQPQNDKDGKLAYYTDNLFEVGTLVYGVFVKDGEIFLTREKQTQNKGGSTHASEIEILTSTNHRSLLTFNDAENEFSVKCNEPPPHMSGACIPEGYPGACLIMDNYSCEISNGVFIGGPC